MTNPISNLLGIAPPPQVISQEAFDRMLLDVRLPPEHDLYKSLVALKESLRIRVSEGTIELADGENGTRRYTHINTPLGPRALIYIPKEIPLVLLRETEPSDRPGQDAQRQEEATRIPHYGSSITLLGTGFGEKTRLTIVIREGLNVLLWSYLHTLMVRWPKLHKVKARVIPWSYVAQIPSVDEATKIKMIAWILELPSVVDPELTEEDLKKIATIIARLYRDRGPQDWRGKLGLGISGQFADNFPRQELERAAEEVSLQVVKRLVTPVSLPSVYSLRAEPPLAAWLRFNLEKEIIPTDDKEFLEGIIQMYQPTPPSI